MLRAERAVQLLSLFLVYAPSPCYATASAPQVCSGLTNTPASAMLRGKTIVVQTTAWSPFSVKDPGAASGWTGLDFDLLNRYAEILGFNYTVEEFGRETIDGTRESWNDALARVSGSGHAVLTYWARTQVRLESYVLMNGHVDQRCIHPTA